MQKFTLTSNVSEIKQFYEENGFVIMEKFFTDDEIDTLKNDLASLFENTFQEKVEDIREFISKKYSDKDKWQSIARTMYDMFSYVRLNSDKKVEDLLKIIGLRKPMYSSRGEIRLDMPNDDKYRQPDHQDWIYTCRSFNAVTTWTPMHNVSIDDGTISVIPKSHKFGLLDYDVLMNPRRFVIKDSLMKRFEKDRTFVEINKGDMVVFSQMLIHGSGINQTNLARMTFQFRFTDSEEISFIKRGYPNLQGHIFEYSYFMKNNEYRKIII